MHLEGAETLAFANQSFHANFHVLNFHSNKLSVTSLCYLECCHLLVLMLAYECDCLVVRLCTEVVLSLLRPHCSEVPDHEVSRVQVNSYAGMQLLHGMTCSQRKD